MIITIDGPSGSGKTTLAINLAKQLHFFCMSSGYLYRAVVYILKKYYDYDDQKMQNPNIEDVQAILSSPHFKYEYEHGLIKLYWIDDITVFLKEVEVSRLTPLLSKNTIVREMIKNYEKALVASKDSIVEGRACGSSMYPQADIKFYVSAPVEIRAQRLQKDQMKRGNQLSIQNAIEQIKNRDLLDVNRELDPLVIPQDAIILDSHDYTSQELLEHVATYVKNHLKNKLPQE